MTPWIKMLAAFATAGLVAACGGGDDTASKDAQQRDVAEAAQAEGNLKKFVAAADASGVMPQMQGKDSLTLLAPSDDALAEMAADLDELMQPDRRAQLADFVKAHLVPSKMLSEQMVAAAGSGGGSVTNLLGESIELRSEGGTLVVNGAKAQKVDVQARNGVVHVFSAPIWRPSVFGIVRVLPQLETLERAIRAAGLQSALIAPGGKTLFAPTNRAFELLLADLKLSADQLFADKALLTKVLTYHVLASKVLARDVTDGSSADTLQGQPIRFGVQPRPFFPDITLTDAQGRTAKVVLPNLRARNGVVHLIDRVILPQTKNIVELAQSLPDFSILVEAVGAAGLADALSQPGPFTVFAPTNAAFADLLGELRLTKAQLLADKPLLTKVLLYHVVNARVAKKDVPIGTPITTLQGGNFSIDGTLTITDANGRKSRIVATDVFASNGVVHVIDKVILPQTKNIVELAQSLPDFSILVEAVGAAGLADALSQPGPFTVFAPTNAAFADLLGELHLTKAQLLADKTLLTKVLLYHVLNAQVAKKDVPIGTPITTLQGGSFSIDSTLTITDANGRKSRIVATDVFASNGVVHAIDKVILPQTKNIVELAQSLPDFSILVEAVGAAGLADALSQPGPFTVFAPTNAAFADLLGELHLTKAQLLADKPLLTKVLLYHVLNAQVAKKDVPIGTPITTLQGGSFSIDSTLTITDANGRKSRIVATDVFASNGVVHVIDKVILPPN